MIINIIENEKAKGFDVPNIPEIKKFNSIPDGDVVRLTFTTDEKDKIIIMMKSSELMQMFLKYQLTKKED